MIMEFFMYKNVNDSKESYKNVEGSPTLEKYRHYQNSPCTQGQYQYQTQTEPMSTPMLMLIFVIYLALGIYAAKLSWYSNSKAGWSNGYKVIFAILAFMFPVTYITAHILFKLDLLSRIKGNSKYSL
jgi:hypothetical protein